MVLGEEKLIIFLYQYKLSIILEEHSCNCIYSLYRVIIRGCGGWYSIFAKLIVGLATGTTTDVTTQLTNNRVNSRTNSRVAELAVSGADSWTLDKTDEGEDRVNDKANNWTLGETNKGADRADSRTIRFTAGRANSWTLDKTSGANSWVLGETNKGAGGIDG